MLNPPFIYLYVALALFTMVRGAIWRPKAPPTPPYSLVWSWNVNDVLVWNRCGSEGSPIQCTQVVMTAR